MKTLKFMLAAATAIGLVSAYAEPDAPTSTANPSTSFEGLSVGTDVVTGLRDDGGASGASFFYYAGDTAEDNESKIISIEGTGSVPARPRGAANLAPTSSKILQVSTGEKPLLRTLNALANGAPTTDDDVLKFTQDVYIDTLVQFTVTPSTDSVKPGESDKLMIYFNEFAAETNALGEVTKAPSTNLVVVGGFFTGDNTVPKQYVLDTGAIEVNPNEWHRLTVRAVADISGSEGNGFPGFQIWIDGTLCTLADGALTYDSENSDATDLFSSFEYAEAINEGKYVLSLLAGGGNTTATLQAVGFAGEGKVDDLMITSGLDPFATVYDFTFAYDTDKITAVSYTVGGQAKDQAVTNMQVEDGTQVVINSITFDGSYELDTISLVGLRDDGNNTYTVTNNATLTIVAQEKQNTPLDPGQQDPTTYTTPEAAAAAAAKVTVGVPTAVATAFGDDAAKTAAYKALFEAKVVPNTGVEGGYKVEVGLTEAAEAALQTQVDDDAAEVIEDLSESTVTLTTTPGLYYSFEYGTSLQNMTEGVRTMATGSSLELTRPTTENATAGFYKVLVNVTDKE